MRKLKNRKEVVCHVTFLNSSLSMTELDLLKKWSELSFAEFSQTSVKLWDIPQGQKRLRSIRWLIGDPSDVHAEMHTRSSAWLLLKECITEHCDAQYPLKLHFPFCEIALPRFHLLFRQTRRKQAMPAVQEVEKQQIWPPPYSARCCLWLVLQLMHTVAVRTQSCSCWCSLSYDTCAANISREAHKISVRLLSWT